MVDDMLTEAAHLNLQINQERSGAGVKTLVGHISAVDPTTNRIKVVIPSWTNDNQTYTESGWIPLGTSVAGNQFGIQLLPFGQATVTDVTGENQAENGNTPMAEQALVHVLGDKRGLYVHGVQMFNQVDVPPAGYEDPSGVQPNAGEWLYKHSSGQYIYFENANALTIKSYTNPAPVVQTDQTPTSATQTLNLEAAVVGDQTNTNGDDVTSASAVVNIKSTSSGATATTNSDINITAENPDAENEAVNTTNIALNSNVTAGSVGQANLDLKSSSKGAVIDNAEFTLEAETESTGTCSGTINVNASELGAGTLDINVKGLTADLNITLSGITNVMTITVTNGIINVISDDVNVECLTADIVAGTSATVTTPILTATCSTVADINAPLVNILSGLVTLGNNAAVPLLNAFTAFLLNGHTHSGVMSGAGTTGPMVEQITTEFMCRNVNGS